MSTPIPVQHTSTANVLRQFYALTKPRVVQLIVFCALIGMVLAVPGLPSWFDVQRAVLACIGIWLVAGAAAAFNCLVEKGIDAKMKRTAWRPTARGQLSDMQALVFSALLCAAGSVLLKPATPQNIVIGGASGAMPPVLGWAAVTGDVPPEALLLFLIIFVWTPPHFWSLALFRRDEYAKARLPMLPVTHGVRYTQVMIVLYTVALVGVTLMPYALRMSGLVYLVAAIVLGAMFLHYAVRLYVAYSDHLARAMFRFSIVYLAALFSALLLDHFLQRAF